MKFSVSGLKDFLDTDATASEIADACTRIGLEVEAIENPADKLSAFRIAKVLTAAPHPQADKLQVLSIDAGGEPLQVVCGAPNARAGMIGVFGPAGAVVPSNGMVLKVAAIRGVESNGMMCSSRELELGDDHNGIIELAPDAPVGVSYADWAGLDDAVIDVAVTPNKQDCMGVYGIARDLAAAGVGALKPLLIKGIVGSFPCPTEIRTDDPAGCPAFYGRVIRSVTNPPSPDWMQARLKAVGQRPISALVDITNYVMLAYGRPSHAYDLAKLTGAVFARRAVEGETVTVLNGKTYTLTAGMTVIADETSVHDIAGIMGGEHSGCSGATTDVLLEVAYFTPESIARTGQALSLTSDARTRFERGVDPAFLDDGLEIITKMILDICGGEASEVVHAGAPPLEPKVIAYDPTHCVRLGGIDIAPDEQRAILRKLGFLVSENWYVTAPTWRRDVDGSADIVEEIVRIVGLDNIPATPLPRADGVAKPTATPAQMIERKVRRTAASRGLNEAITWSFLSEAQAAAFGGGVWSLDNPISEDMKVMRPTMLAGLLSAAARNANRGADSIRLFEIGRRYLADSERATAGVVLAGNRIPRGWTSGKAQIFDAYDAKAEALALLAAAGVPVDNLQVMGFDSAALGGHFHPGQSGTLRLGPKTILASFGAVHPTTAKAFDLNGPVVAAEIFLDAVPAKRTTGFMRPAFSPAGLQPVKRDFAFLVPLTMSSADLIRAVKSADKAIIVAARLFDRFAGDGVTAGHVSLAFEVTLQPADKSFTDAELKAISDRIVAAALKAGAALRG